MPSKQQKRRPARPKPMSPKAGLTKTDMTKGKGYQEVEGNYEKVASGIYRYKIYLNPELL